MRRSVPWRCGFFFQAEDGIRDGRVTGVQTCALPIYTGEKGGIQTNPLIVGRTLYAYTPTQKVVAVDAATGTLKWKFYSGIHGSQPAREIGRASCRERVERSGVPRDIRNNDRRTNRAQ